MSKYMLAYAANFDIQFVFLPCYLQMVHNIIMHCFSGAMISMRDGQWCMDDPEKKHDNIIVTPSRTLLFTSTSIALVIDVDIIAESPNGEDVSVVTIRDHAVHVENTRNVLYRIHGSMCQQR